VLSLAASSILLHNKMFGSCLLPRHDGGGDRWLSAWSYHWIAILTPGLADNRQRRVEGHGEILTRKICAKWAKTASGADHLSLV